MRECDREGGCMSTEIFLAAFLGCLFALAFVPLAIWGVIKIKVLRPFKQSPAELARMMRAANPEAEGELREFSREILGPQIALCPECAAKVSPGAHYRADPP